MSLDNGITQSSTFVASRTSINILLLNLRLLDLDKCGDWPSISAQVFTGKDSPDKQRTRIQYVEWICYHLYQIWDPAECQRRLLPFYPPFEPLQSLNLRAALFRCLNDLKKDGSLGRDITIRKSIFDDCKGETFLKLLSAFSIIVLQRVLFSNATNRTSIAGQLSLGKNVPLEDRFSLLPLAMAHRASLIKLLETKRVLRARYLDFRNALDNKDQDLTGKFEKIVATQDFLDQNPPSESTVDRVSRVLDQHWQGDRRLVDVVAEGEEHKISDVLLDNEFENVWKRVSIGQFDGDISVRQHELLEDLEKRLADQQARLEQWKAIKNSLGTKERVPPNPSCVSPATKALFSPKSLRYEQREEKELVFSPRKSPRKSIWPAISQPEPDAFKNANELNRTGDSDDKQLNAAVSNTSDRIGSSPLAAKSKIPPGLVTADVLPSSSPAQGHNDSSFSDILITDIETSDEKKASGITTRGCITDMDSGKEASLLASTPQKSPAKEHDQIVIDNLIKIHESKDREMFLTSRSNPAKEATPTPSSLPLSLVQRTQKSMGPASSTTGLLNENPAAPTSHGLDSSEKLFPEIAIESTLAERTRQSILAVPARPKRSIDPTHARRSTAKIYPTNQFQTPQRQLEASKLTPPETLMSPTAGYDSVFKSRPKVAMSPPSSPSLRETSKAQLEFAFGHEFEE